MLVHANEKKPIKIWLKSMDDLEETCLEQAINLANLPFLHKHVALMPDCLTEDAEILTPTGFKLIKDLVKGEVVANYNPKSGEVEWHPVKDIIVRSRKPMEKIYRFDFGMLNTSMTLSENHRVAYKSTMGVKAKELPGVTKIKDYQWEVTSISNPVQVEHTLTFEEVLLLLWVVGDGSIKRGNWGDRIAFGLKKKRKIRRVTELLDTIGLDYSVSTSKKETSVIIKVQDSLKYINSLGEGKNYPFDIIHSLNKETAKQVLEEMVQIDGDYESFKNKGTLRLNTSREADVNFITTIISMYYGVATIKSRRTDSDYGVCDMWYVNAIPYSSFEFSKNGMHNREVVRTEVGDYTGDLVCVTCDTGYFVAKQGDMTFISGNCHTGWGMPVGGVIATKGAIVPNAVGVDIGCGMAYIGTDLKLSDIDQVQTKSGSLTQVIIGDFLRNIPVGFAKHKDPQTSEVLDKAKEELHKYEATPELLPCIDAGYYQVGTLGGGNHFLELQVDDEGFIGLMVHSGSRNFGKQICDNFNKKAVQLNALWHSSVPAKHDLAFLPTDTVEGQQYINWMNLALDYAYENRSRMIKVASELLIKHVLKHTGITVNLTEEINCHHNYAAIEHHYGQNVWVHRKGATRARAGEVALIPGAMGSYSYVVAGLGNSESFHSCSHGAGRQYSRRAALEKFSAEEVMVDLKTQGVVLGKHNKADVAEESRFAYKDISEVMDNQKDLVRAIKRLRTVGVIKG